MKLNGKICVMVAGSVLGFLLLPGVSWGQRTYVPYQPPGGSPISPALDYARIDTSPLGNPYYSFVQPTRQMQAGMNQMQRQLQQQQTTIGDLKNQLLLQTQNPGMQPTGTGATFLNYSHYYRFPQRR